MSLAKSYTKSTSSPTHLFGLGRRQKRDCSGNEVDTKCGRDTIPRLFSKRSKLIISLDQQSKDLYSLILLCAKLKAIEIR